MKNLFKTTALAGAIAFACSSSNACDERKLHELLNLIIDNQVIMDDNQKRVINNQRIITGNQKRIIDNQRIITNNQRRGYR